MSRARNADQAKADHIQTLRAVIAGMAIAIAVLFGFLFYAMRDINLHIPPDITEGGHLGIDNVPKVVVFEFAQTIWKKVNRWEEDGEEESERNLALYQHYLTPSCRSALRRQYTRARTRGEIQKRERLLATTSDHTYQASHVHEEGAGVWHTDLQLNLVEIVQSTPVKDIVVRYPLRIVRFDVDRDANPWGLAIDCFYEEPQLIKDNLLGESL